MSIETDGSVSPEKKIEILKSALKMYQGQLEAHDASQAAHSKMNPGFIGFGIAESLELNQIITRLKKQISELEEQRNQKSL